jgi:hypothetical protein
MAHTSLMSQKHSNRNDKFAFSLIFVPCFVVLFSVAILGQLVGLQWKTWLPGAENMSNIVSGVRATVYTLMSHII